MTVPVLDPERAAEVRSLVVLMDRVLESVQGVYAQAGVPLPERRYWLMGTAAADCEQLVVSFIQGYLGPPGDEAASPQRCESLRSAVISVQIHRCIPTVGNRGKAPAPEAIQLASEMLAIDAFLLLESAAALDQWDRDTGGPGFGVIATVQSGEAQGGFQATSLDLTLVIP